MKLWLLTSSLVVALLAISTAANAGAKIYYAATCHTNRGNLPSGQPAPDYCTCAGKTACVDCSSHTCSRDAVLKAPDATVDGKLVPEKGKVEAKKLDGARVDTTPVLKKSDGYDVGIRKTGESTLVIGQTATFVLRPYNTGPSAVGSSSGVVVTDVLPASFTTPVTANGNPGWNCSVSGVSVSCAYTGGPVGAGQAMPWITITAVAAKLGEGRNCAKITIEVAVDTKPLDNEGCVSLTVSPVAPNPVLTIRKIVIPGNDPGRFNLLLDGIVRVSAVGNNANSGGITTTAGTHVVSETASPPTSMANYTATFSGDCNSAGSVTLIAGDNKTCVITNRRMPDVLSASVPLGNLNAIELATINHGSWTQGPGVYTFTVCAATTCNINGTPGQSVPVTIEAWGGGGGGGGGRPHHDLHGGTGGGAGGGGGYGKTTIAATVPSSGMVVLSIVVGNGGGPGATGSAVAGGLDGGFSDVRFYSSAGALVLKATGGFGGKKQHQNASTGGAPGVGGTGTVNNWAGGAGGTGAVVSGCNGGGGGLGGPGGGPGRTGPGYVNDGGNGGHGGYFRSLTFPTCLAASDNYGMTPGVVGGNGRVTLVW